jgi:aspartate/methionine/tyrosine aminotransferase
MISVAREPKPAIDRESAPDSSPPAGPNANMRSPFMRLADLIGNIAPGKPVIDLGVGEPRHPIPDFAGPVMAAHINDLGRYPRNEGIPEFRAAVSGWVARRYGLARAPDPSEIQVLAGSREGLFLGAIAARRYVPPRAGRPAILVPNPFYAAYSAGAIAADCEVVYLPGTRESGFLPDLDAIDPSVLARTVVFYIASPSNPQGAVASLDYLKRILEMARRHGFLVFCDECYSEIYSTTPPAGILQAAAPDFANAVLFQSLSKRSSLPGLRVGFAAGDRNFIKKFLELRSVSAPQVPIPAQHVAVAAYSDETYVEKNRDLYRRKFDLADQIIGDRYGYKRPAGGFFLWLDVSAHGTSEAVTERLWREGGVRVLPGNYCAREQQDGSNPGAGYIRVAMVHDQETTAEALHRIVAVLG